MLALVLTLAAVPASASDSAAASVDLARQIETLAAPKQTSPDNFRKLFLEMWAQVPNWKSGDPMWIRKPEPPWKPPPPQKGQPRPKRPPPHDPETLDWMAALDAVDLDAAASLDPLTTIPPPWTPPGKKAPPPPPLPPFTPATRDEMARARAEAKEVVLALRALSASRRPEAVEPMFNVAFQYDGVFRDEVGRQIRAMESYAVPTLIRLVYADKRAPKQRRYASYQLDRMDRQRPQKAIATAPDDRLRADIIHAYGETHALDAVDAILGQVDAASHRVRREARWAWLGYVTGKAPPPAPKRKRKLPGGQEEQEEKADYLTYRELATLALQKEVAAIENRPVDPNATAKQLTDELFAYYDKKRAAEWDALFAAAREKEARGDLKGATDDDGFILAHDPSYARKAEMAGAFRRYGDRLVDENQVPRALGYFRQAIDLAPDGPEARIARARVLAFEAWAALDHGRADVEAFDRARALDPSLALAKRGRARAHRIVVMRGLGRVVEALAVLLGLATILWIAWRKTAPRPA